MSEMKSVLGTNARTVLDEDLPIFVTLNSNTLDIPGIILAYSEDGSIIKLGIADCGQVTAV